MPNYNPKTEHLPKQKTAWQHLPTKAVRVPEIFLEEIEKFARSLDGQCSPFEAIISALDKLSSDELEQIKLAIESLSSNDIKEKIVQTTLPQASLPIPELSNHQIADYKAKFGFVPSRFQLGIIDWVINQKGNGCCNAVAGSGKSSTLRIVARTLCELGLRPNEIKICVFGKDNSVDLIKKFGPVWKTSISTLHSAAFTLVKQELRVKRSEDIDISKYKYERIAQSLDLIPKRGRKIGRLRQESIIDDDGDFLKLIDLVRLNNEEPTAEVVEAIARHHEINVHKPQLVAQWIAYCLKIGEEMAISQRKLDFTDQIWLAVKWRLHQQPWFKPYKFVLIDECLPGNSLVTLADGSQMSIQSIVEGRLPVSVLSYNEQMQTIEAKPVTGWRKVLRRDRQVLQIGDLRATEDHPVFTREQGYIPMAKAVMSQVHVMVIDHEKLRFEYQINSEGAINYRRVATWRCFYSTRQLEREAMQCQSKIHSWKNATALLEVEGKRITTLDWNICNRETSFNRVWRFNSPSFHTNSSSIYGDLAFNQTRGQEETHYSRTFATTRRFSDRSLVYGRWEYGTSEFDNCSLLVSTRRPRTSLQLVNSKGNYQQSFANVQRANNFNQCRGYSYFEGSCKAFHPPLFIVQIGNNSSQKLCNLSGQFSNLQRIANAADLQPKMRGNFKGKNDEPNRSTFQAHCNLSNLWSSTQSQESRPSNEENLREKELCSESANYVTEKWVYCLDVEHNHNFFANSTLVHNCQDLNPLQLSLTLMLAGLTGRILAVGDPRQAIMGFAGADNQSYNNIVRLTGATELPLSICYRCPLQHIALVKSIFPYIPIEAAPDAIEGIIHKIESKDIEKLVKHGDIIICRKTAPLVSLCIRLISQGVKATVKGRDVGDFLKKELDQIAKLPGYSFKFFNDAVDQYRQIKLQQYLNLDNEDELKQRLADRLEAIATIYQSQTQATSIESLKYYIDELFSDDNSPVTLSTIHKFKGGEGERIFVHKAGDMPMVWRNQRDWQLEQEQNLLYVALTRSKSELFIVGECDWYKPPSGFASDAPNVANAALTQSTQCAFPSLREAAPTERYANAQRLVERTATDSLTTDKQISTSTATQPENDDYFSLCRKAREELDKELTPIFKNANSRAKFIKTVIDDDIDLRILESSGKIKYTSSENKKAVYTAIENYWEKYFDAEDEDENEKHDDSSSLWPSFDDVDF
nr:UvrD-helicase domain-containing protein [Nostoc sp. JL33]